MMLHRRIYFYFIFMMSVIIKTHNWTWLRHPGGQRNPSPYLVASAA